MLGLGKLPDRSERKIAFAAPASLAADLDTYARIYGETYGSNEKVETLIPFMLEAFLKRDTGFQKARKDKHAAGPKAPPFASSSSSIPKTEV